MPFGLVSRVGRGMGVTLDGGGDRRRERAVLVVNLGRPIVTKGDFVAQLCESDALFPNYFWGGLFNMLKAADSSMLFSYLQLGMYRALEDETGLRPGATAPFCPHQERSWPRGSRGPDPSPARTRVTCENFAKQSDNSAFYCLCRGEKCVTYFRPSYRQKFRPRPCLPLATPLVIADRAG